MKRFLETTFGPVELAIVEEVFSGWMKQANLEKGSPEAELAAAIMINLFREGNNTVSSLSSASSTHRALVELGSEGHSSAAAQ